MASESVDSIVHGRAPRGLDPAKRLVFFSILVVGLLAFAELASYAALWVREGALPRWSRWMRERERAARSDQADAAAQRRMRWNEHAIEGTFYANETLHPYMGFVNDPAGEGAALWKKVGRQGFRRGDPPLADTSANVLHVGVFGGSVAERFAFQGAEELGRELRRVPAWSHRGIEVVNYALPGYKQPQQLMALNYFLALGDPIDVVIVLDGFNEVVLPAAENQPSGVDLFYPRAWAQRIAGLPDVATQRMAGELALLRERRATRALWCSGALLSRSALCELFWSSFDRRLGAREIALEVRIARSGTGAAFAMTGPHEVWPESAGKIYEASASIWARSSSVMFALCRGKDIPYFHFLQPSQYVEGSKPMNAREERLAVNDSMIYAPHARAGYPVLMRKGRELAAGGVPFFDLTRVFAAEPRPLYVDDCCHFSALGNEIVGRAIGSAIVDYLAAHPLR